MNLCAINFVSIILLSYFIDILIEYTFLFYIIIIFILLYYYYLIFLTIRNTLFSCFDLE